MTYFLFTGSVLAVSVNSATARAQVSSRELIASAAGSLTTASFEMTAQSGSV